MTVEEEDSGNLGVIQRKLTKREDPPGDILSYGTTELILTDAGATGFLEMAYDAAAEFNFTDFLTCKIDEIDFVAAFGNTTEIGYHYDNRVGGMKLKRSDNCICNIDDSSANNILNGFYLIFAVCIAFLFH